MATIIGTLPNNLQNGTIADASQVMADLNFIVNQVNANAIAAGTTVPGAFLGTQVFTSSGTYTPTTGMTKVIGIAQGGGGAGGGASGAVGGNVSLGAPGGAGTWAQFFLTSVQVGASQIITIGGGGAGAAGGNGFAGGVTSIGTLISCPGGVGGTTSVNVAAPAQIGNGSSTGGGLPTGSGTILSYQLGVCQYLVQAYSGTVGQGGAGASSGFGPGASPAPMNTPPVNANNYGAGGGGTVVNAAGGTGTGGSGKGGIVILFEYA